MDSEENERVKTKYDNIAGIYGVVDLLIPDAWRRRKVLTLRNIGGIIS